MRGVRSLAIDEKDIAPRVTMEASHGAQVRNHCLAVAAFQSFCELRESVLAERFGLFGRHHTPPMPRKPPSGGSSFRRALGRAFQFGDPIDPDLGDALLGSGAFGSRIGL